MRLTASIVLYQNDRELYGRAISSYLDGCDGALFVVDNSPKPLHHDLFSHSRVEYVFSGTNLGFGRAHNLALNKFSYQSDFHLFLNPDVQFGVNVIPRLLSCVMGDRSIGAIMPQIRFPNGEIQLLHKLLPTPLDLFVRRFLPASQFRDRMDSRYELHALSQNTISCVPSLSGCFLLVRTDLLRVISGFDERYFMYLEDVDLVRRVGDHAKTVYCPLVSVVHSYAKGSYYNRRLLVYHILSAIKYFNKWGWFRDEARFLRNELVMKNLSI